MDEYLKITGRIRTTLVDIVTGEIKIKEINNLVVTTGKVAIARRLGGIALLANEGEITYGAVGTDNTAPAVTDTGLGTELFRKVLSSSSYSSNTVTVNTFLTTAEGNGAIEEIGMFGEAAGAGAGSGTLFNHALASITKDATKTLLIEVTFTVS
jgi:hypothetical protein